MTGHLGAGVQIDEFGNLLGTAFVGIEAAAVENATAGQVDGRGHLALQFDVLGFLAAELRYGAQQGPGVRVAGRLVQFAGGAQFADRTEIHHRHPGTEMLYHG